MNSCFARCGRLLAIPAAAIVLAGSAQAHSHKFKNLEIVHPWCIETQDLNLPVAVYMTIRSSGGRPDKLLRATTSIAAKAELHAGAQAGDGKAIASVTVASRGTVDLKRDGSQVRLSGVKRQLGAYDSFMMTLVFERAGKVEVMVEEASVLEPAKH